MPYYVTVPGLHLRFLYGISKVCAFSGGMMLMCLFVWSTLLRGSLPLPNVALSTGTYVDIKYNNIA